MIPLTLEQPTVVRTEMGLTIADTRITLYDVMDYLKADWPPSLIQDWLDLSSKQMTDVMEYIETHRDEVEAEYERVVQHAQKVRDYWEDRNRERLAQIALLPPKLGQEELYAKIQRRKAELGLR